MEESKEDLTPDFDEKEEERKDDSAISSDLIRGHINTIILRTLWNGDKYGYEIISEIEKKSHGQYSIKQPTLYSALKRLESQGFVKAYWGGSSGGGRRRYFQLTDQGRESYQKNQEEWEYSRSVIDSLISDNLMEEETASAEDASDQGAQTAESNSSAQAESDQAESAVQQPATESSSPAVPEAETSDLTQEAQTEQEAQAAQEESTTPAAEELSQPIQAPAAESEPVVHTIPTAAQDQAQTDSPAQPVQHQADQDAALPLAEEPVQTEAEPKQEAPVRRIVAAGKSTHSSRIHSNYINLLRGEIPNEEETESEQTYIAYEEPAYGESTPYMADPQYQSTINKLYNNAIDTYDPAMDESAYADESYDEPDDLSGVKVSGNLEFYDILERAEYDGIKVYTSGGYKLKEHNAPAVVSSSFYNKGLTLFKSALVTFFVILAEFLLVLVSRNASGVSMPYCFTILGVDVVMLVTFTLLMFSGFGKHARRKRGDKSYIVTACILFAIFALLVAAVAIGTGATMTTLAEIMKNIGIPLIVGLSIPLFSIFFYLFTNQTKQ